MRITNSLLAIALAVVLAACGGNDASTETTAAGATIVAAAQPTITISGFAFGDPLSVVAGQEVLVTNADATTHTWTSRDGVFDSGNLGPGTDFTFTFDSPGEYGFFCAIHGSMTGTITVTG
jgi:plastocyanin